MLARDPSTGALSNASCVDDLAKPVVRDKEEEEEEEEGEEGREEATPAPQDPCTSAPAVAGVSVVAVQR